MARKSGFVRRGGSMRRETMWISIGASVVTLAAASAATLFTSLNAAGLALRPFTIVRTRGFWHVTSDQAAAAEGWGCSLGGAVVSDQALAAGINSVPTPELDRGSDLFFLHETQYGKLEFVSGVGIFEAGSGKDFDSKAMRKVNDDQDIAMVVEVPAAGSSSAVVRVAGRILLKLH